MFAVLTDSPAVFVVPLFAPLSPASFSDGYEYYSDEDEYSSGEEEYELEKLPWSEGGEGGIGSLGLGESPLKDGAGSSVMLGALTYSEDELQQMVDILYGEEGGGKQVGPGAWGKGKWRPKGDA